MILDSGLWAADCWVPVPEPRSADWLAVAVGL
jgi:hypothetical protein